MSLFTLNLLGYAHKAPTSDQIFIHSEESVEGLVVLNSAHIEQIVELILGKKSSVLELKYLSLNVDMEGEAFKMTWPSEGGGETAVFDKLEFLKTFSPHSVRTYLLSNE